MPKRRFKIGERAIGGIIEVRLDKDEQEVTLRALDWDTHKQVRPEEASDDLGYLQNVLWDWTDSYHTDMIVEWLSKQGFEEAGKRW